MKRYCIYAAALLLILTPVTSSAFTGEGEVTRLSSNAFLYTETITLNVTADTLTVPIAAVPSWQPRSGDDSVKYTTLINNRPVAGLTTSAMVLSSTPIVGNRYALESGQPGEFTLAILLSLPGDVRVTEGTEVAFTVTAFPVAMHLESETITLSSE